MTEIRDGEYLIVTVAEESPPEDNHEDYVFRRLPPSPEGYPQCGCSLAEMAPTSGNGSNLGWRQSRYGPAAKDDRLYSGWAHRSQLDPNFCTRRGIIDVLGTPMCDLHASKIALKIFLGEYKI